MLSLQHTLYASSVNLHQLLARRISSSLILRPICDWRMIQEPFHRDLPLFYSLATLFLIFSYSTSSQYIWPALHSEPLKFCRLVSFLSLLHPLIYKSKSQARHRIFRYHRNHFLSIREEDYLNCGIVCLVELYLIS